MYVYSYWVYTYLEPPCKQILLICEESFHDLYVFREEIHTVGDQKNVLNLSLFEPYNELITRFNMIERNSGLEVIPDDFQVTT